MLYLRNGKFFKPLTAPVRVIRYADSGITVKKPQLCQVVHVAALYPQEAQCVKSSHFATSEHMKKKKVNTWVKKITTTR